MSGSRVESSKRNTGYGIIIIVLKTIITFVVRTFFIKQLGIEILGINGLMTEVVGMLSLAELGVGMAIVYNLYEPLASNDIKKISSLMTLFRKAYAIIAAVVLACGLILLPFVKYIVTDVKVSDNYLYIIYAFFLGKTVCSYLLSYKTSLLNADQKQYIVSLVGVIIQVITSALGIMVLVCFSDYFGYLGIQIFGTLATNVIISFYVNKKYPEINYKEQIEKEEKKKVFKNIKDLFIKRVSGVVTSSTDNILISIFVSTVIVGFYSNYTTILGVFKTLRSTITLGLAGSIGNLFVTSTSEKCIDVLKKLTYLYFFMGMIICAGLFAGFQPFISAWIGSDYLLSTVVVAIIVVNMFIEILFDPLWQYLEVSGLFSADKKIAILGTVINLIVSVLLGYFIGIAGILIGTFLTQVIQFILKTVLIFKRKFLISPIKYFLYVLELVALFIVEMVAIFFMNRYLVLNSSLLQFFVSSIIACVFAVALSILPFIKSREFKYFLDMLRGMLKKVFRKNKEKSMDSLQGKTVLVTGVAGFIGSNLVLRLLKSVKNIQVIGVDNMNDYYDVNIKKYRLGLLTEYENFTFIPEDISNMAAVNKVFETYSPNIVVNLAAQAGVRYSITNPDAYITSNIIGFYNILEACRHSFDNNARGVEHLVYASSSSVYGNNEKIPYSTDDKTDTPVSLYAATKKSNELMAHAYSKLYNIPSTGLRFFTVYGPAGRPDMAYFGFTNKLRAGETIEIFNYGNCKRDFTYIDDIVEGVIRVMRKPPEKKQGEDGLPIPPCAVYNIGNSQPENLLDFVDILQQELIKAGVLQEDYDFEAHKKLVPMQAGDVPITYSDTKPFEETFGYKPDTPLRDGLRKFAEWYKEFYLK